MIAAFDIVRANDKRYNVTWWTLFGICLISATLGYLNFFDQILLVLVLGISIICMVIVRYIFKDHIKIGQLIIRNNQISINLDNTSQTLSNIREMEFHYEGFYAATNMRAMPTKDGTGNKLKIILDKDEQLELNIYLNDRDQKERLLYVLNWFCNQNNIELSSGLLVSI